MNTQEPMGKHKEPVKMEETTNTIVFVKTGALKKKENDQ